MDCSSYPSLLPLHTYGLLTQASAFMMEDSEGYIGTERMAQESPQEIGEYRDWTEHQILLDADEFITKYELHDLRELLRKGALLAHDPTNASYLEELRGDHSNILIGTIAAPLPSIRSLLRRVLFGVAAVTCGWMLGPYDFDDAYDPFQTSWIHVVMSMAGCLLVIALGLCLTPRKIMLAFGILLLINFILQIVWLDEASDMAKNTNNLVVVGLDAARTCAAPIYLAEMSPPELRGTLISAWIGIISVVRVQRAIFANASGSRLLLPTAVASAVFLATLITSRESPYPLIARGEMRKAYRSLCSLRTSNLMAARDLFRIYHQFETSSCALRRTKPPRRHLESTKIYQALSPPVMLLLPLVLMGLQYDSPLRVMGVLLPNGHAMSQMVVVLSLQGLFFSALALKKFGRRIVLIGTILISLLARFVMSLGNVSYPLIAIPAIVQHILWETALFTLPAEALSYTNRGIGVGFVSFLYYGSSLLVQPLAKLQVYGFSKYLYGTLNMAALIPVFLFTIETGDLNLEEARAKLKRPLKRVAAYRISVEVPYLVQRYILRKPVELVSLEDFDPCFDEINLN